MKKGEIRICLGSSCYSRGNNKNLEEIKSFLAKNNLEAEISFSGHLCKDRCSKGPVISINGHIYEQINISGLHKILQEEFSC